MKKAPANAVSMLHGSSTGSPERQTGAGVRGDPPGGIAREDEKSAHIAGAEPVSVLQKTASVRNENDDEQNAFCGVYARDPSLPFASAFRDLGFGHRAFRLLPAPSQTQCIAFDHPEKGEGITRSSSDTGRGPAPVPIRYRSLPSAQSVYPAA